LTARICVVVERESTHRQYYAEIEGNMIAGGPEDEVADGVTGTFHATPLTLRCPAPLEAHAAVGRRDCSLRAANLVDLIRVRIWRE